MIHFNPKPHSEVTNAFPSLHGAGRVRVTPMSPCDCRNAKWAERNVSSLLLSLDHPSGGY